MFHPTRTPSTRLDCNRERNGDSFLLRLLLNRWVKQPNDRNYGKFASVTILCLILFIISWISLNFYTRQRLYTDSGVFATVSQHLLSGKTLYLDVWDHKPPLIYWIDAVPIVMGDGSIQAIRFYERIYAVIGLCAFFFTVLWIFQNPLLAFVASLAFNLHFFNPIVFQGGNLTEEYAVVFMVCGMALAAAARARGGSCNVILAGVSGLLFSLAVFCKETFLVSAIPWFAYLVIDPQPGVRFAGRRALFFLGGAFLPAFVWAAVLLIQGNGKDWLDVLSFNVQYARRSQSSPTFGGSVFAHARAIAQYVARQTVTVHLLAWVGLLGACILPFVKKCGYFPWFCLAVVGFDFGATMIGGYEIGHYYLQFIPGYILLAASGAAFLLNIRASSLSWKVGVSLFILALFLGFDGRPLSLYRLRLTTPAGKPPLGAISQTILERKKPGDTLWAGRGDNSKFYFETGLLSPSKYIYVYDHLFLDTWLNSGQEKRDCLTGQLMANPPAYIILSRQDFSHFRGLGLHELMDWIESQYQKDAGVFEEGNELFVLRSSSPLPPGEG